MFFLLILSDLISSTMASYYRRYYLHESTEPMVVNRFIEELGFYAYFIGPSYSKDDVLRSVTRIWSRYFGPAVLPADFVEGFYPSLRAIGAGTSLTFALSRGPDHLSYDWGPALFELVATVMFQHWHRWRDGCPIPFEYPELVNACLPPAGAFYSPRFRELLFILSIFLFLI